LQRYEEIDAAVVLGYRLCYYYLIVFLPFSKSSSLAAFCIASYSATVYLVFLAASDSTNDFFIF